MTSMAVRMTLRALLLDGSHAIKYPSLPSRTLRRRRTRLESNESFPLYTVEHAR